MSNRKILLLLIAAVEWLALIAQFIVQQQVAAGSLTFTESLIRFFSYFTVLTNILVAVFTTVALFTPSNRHTSFFNKPGVQTAVTLYITVVGLVYNLVLRQLWTAGGLQAVLHDLLHSVTPVLTIIYWWLWVDTRKVTFANIPVWLIYPAIYALFIVVRGYFAGWYAYPFMDAGKLGYLKVFINSAILTLTFLLFAFLLVYLGHKKRAVIN